MEHMGLGQDCTEISQENSSRDFGEDETGLHYGRFLNLPRGTLESLGRRLWWLLSPKEHRKEDRSRGEECHSWGQSAKAWRGNRTCILSSSFPPSPSPPLDIAHGPGLEAGGQGNILRR